MPQSLSNILVHVVFSTRNREPFISPGLQPRLHAYLATLIRGHGCECYRVGGVADHVHCAVRLSRTLAVCDLIEDIKSVSSKWMKQQGPGLGGFSWQRGYGAFSVSPCGAEELCRYIETQEEHHRYISFMDEYRALLREHGIEFDERYVWD